MSDFTDDQNLNKAMKQLIEWNILEYLEDKQSYQTTKKFKQFIKSIHDKILANPELFPFKEQGVDETELMFRYGVFFIEEFVGKGALTGKDTIAIMSIMMSFMEK